MSDNPQKLMRRESRLAVRDTKTSRFRGKYYDAEKNRFITKEFISYAKDYKVKEFKSFAKFYKYLGGDLSGANLYDYDFEGIKLRKFNIAGAYISSNVLIEQNLYDDSFYNATIKDAHCKSGLMLSTVDETREEVAVVHESDLIPTPTLNDDSRKMHYISDIHLNHKLLKRFPSHATELEVIQYISSFIKKMISTVTDRSQDDYLLRNCY